MENNAQLLKGVLEYCVLRLIEKEPTYGYEIVMQLKPVSYTHLISSTRKQAVSGCLPLRMVLSMPLCLSLIHI